MHYIRPKESDEQLATALEKFCAAEVDGTLAGGISVRSEDDEKGEAILKSTAECTNNEWTVALMFRDQQPMLPFNQEFAMSRFTQQERRLKKKPDYAERYDAVVQAYLDAGHAERETPEEAANRPPWTWFLPHHGVVNPHKPNKVRVVFDAAAEFRGVSLNKKLLRGPNYLASQVGVLLRFRREPVAISGDIRMMYHQVKVPKEQRAALSFIWRRTGDPEPPKVYRMTVHVSSEP